MTALLQHFAVWMSLCAAGLVVVFSVATPIGELAAQEELTGDEARQYALILCDGFDKNRQAFRRFTCRFTAMCGSSRCNGEWWKKDSWETGPIEVFEAIDGVFVKDVNVFRYSTVRRIGYPRALGSEVNKSTRQNPVPNAQPRSFMQCFSEVDILADDQIVCCNDRIGPQAIISPIADWKGFLADLTTPWDHTFPLDRSYLDELRFELENYSFPWNVTRGIRAGSQTLTVVEAVGGSLSYYVDESKGYLPVKIVYIPLVVDKAGGKPRLGNRVHVLFSEVGHVKGHGWLPMQWTYVSSNMGAQTCELWQFKVTELTMGRPKPELIQVKIPAGRHLIDQKNATKLRDLVIDQDTFVTARDLPKLLDRYYNPSKYLGSIGPRRRPAVWAWLLWGVCGVVAAVGGTYLYIRRWRSGRR